ncbi:MFS general substrate transporter [Violaceomyces palustris]|uniref:MFS general substrate transporter n=1 Tax=Violaceomyces palustris TaxID=1673888 RepID=A0ACD0P3S8_9BASI|nr:MFS general substrate transporter [Violaceomyces palustris]
MFNQSFQFVQDRLGATIRGDPNPFSNHAKLSSGRSSHLGRSQKARGRPTKPPPPFPFRPRYSPPSLYQPPRDDREAQDLYNHIRTVTWYLDSFPYLVSRFGCFNLGLDPILGLLIPGGGDLLGLVLGLYQVYLCSLFGLPRRLIFWMTLIALVDFTLGLFPILGDLVDVAFRSNLINLTWFEHHMKSCEGRCGAGDFFHLEFPDPISFLPPSIQDDHDLGQREQVPRWTSRLPKSLYARWNAQDSLKVKGEGGKRDSTTNGPFYQSDHVPRNSGPDPYSACDLPGEGKGGRTGSGIGSAWRNTGVIGDPGQVSEVIVNPVAAPLNIPERAQVETGGVEDAQVGGEGAISTEASGSESARRGEQMVVQPYTIRSVEDEEDHPMDEGENERRRSRRRASSSRGTMEFEDSPLLDPGGSENGDKSRKRRWRRSISPGAIIAPSLGGRPSITSLNASWLVHGHESESDEDDDEEGEGDGEEEDGRRVRSRKIDLEAGGTRLDPRQGEDDIDPILVMGAPSSSSNRKRSFLSTRATEEGYLSVKEVPWLPKPRRSSSSSSSCSSTSSSAKKLKDPSVDSLPGKGSIRIEVADSIGGKGGGSNGAQAQVQASSKRGVSWHDSIVLHLDGGGSRGGLPDFESDGDLSEVQRRRAHPNSHHGHSHGRGSSSRRGGNDNQSVNWKRRRRMYLVVYSAIFCVAYMTSLDANTGYLYLNFACSEYGALASFSTVAIVQQMVFAIAKPPIAKLSDVFGRAEAYVLSLALYVSGYAIVASTDSLRGLIGGICLQSAGNTGVQVLQSIIIADTTTAKWRGLVIGTVNLPYLINFAVAGPLVDAVMRNGGWRWGYAMWTILVPLAATPLLLTLAVGQRRARKAGLATRSPLGGGKGWITGLRQLAQDLDVVGLTLFTVGWLLILLPFTLAGHGERTQGMLDSEYLILTGVFLLAAFGWWETKAAAPILPYQFFQNRAVVCVCVVGILDFASFYISWTFLSSFIQILKGWDQTKTGYFATTQNVTSTLTGIVVGSLMAMTRRFKTLLVGGLVVRIIGVGMMIRYRTSEDPTYMLVLCQLLQGIGGGSVAITMQVAVQVTVKHSDVAIVTALELLTTEIGAAIGSATAGWMFTAHLPSKLRENLPGMDESQLESIYGSLQTALSYPLGSEERQAIIRSWVDVMRTLCVTATLVLLPALFFGMAIPDTSLPDVHASVLHHHHQRRRRVQSQPNLRHHHRQRRSNGGGAGAGSHHQPRDLEPDEWQHPSSSTSTFPTQLLLGQGRIAGGGGAKGGLVGGGSLRVKGSPRWIQQEHVGVEEEEEEEGFLS